MSKSPVASFCRHEGQVSGRKKEEEAFEEEELGKWRPTAGADPDGAWAAGSTKPQCSHRFQGGFRAHRGGGLRLTFQVWPSSGGSLCYLLMQPRRVWRFELCLCPQDSVEKRAGSNRSLHGQWQGANFFFFRKCSLPGTQLAFRSGRSKGSNVLPRPPPCRMWLLPACSLLKETGNP